MKFLIRKIGRVMTVNTISLCRNKYSPLTSASVSAFLFRNKFIEAEGGLINDLSKVAIALAILSSVISVVPRLLKIRLITFYFTDIFCCQAHVQIHFYRIHKPILPVLLMLPNDHPRRKSLQTIFNNVGAFRVPFACHVKNTRLPSAHLTQDYDGKHRLSDHF
jgi:hypothetical protein